MSFWKARRLAVCAAAGALAAGGALATSALADGHHGPGGDGHHGPGGGDASGLYVSPSGSASNSGTSCTQARYSTIQSAVTAATPGATVIVCAGTYAEDVTVAKALTLSGESAVIDATGKNNGITITASSVTVEGFAVHGATGEGILAMGTPNPALVPPGSPAGSITGVPITGVTISHNVVTHNDQGSPTSLYKECQPNGPVPGDCGEGIHLMSVADSTVSGNYVSANSGGILMTDEFGPNHGNVVEHNIVSNNASDCGITMPSHNGLAVNPATLAANPTLGGVYDNTIRENVVVSNGLTGFGAGVLMAAPFPGSGSYDNTVEGNLIEGNGLAGVTIHSHAPGAFIGGNQIIHNTIGINDLTGDSPLSSPPAPVQYQADTVTTGVLVWSAATPTSVTISGNRIIGDTIGVWLNPTVSDPTAASDNEFDGVTTPVGP